MPDKTEPRTYLCFEVEMQRLLDEIDTSRAELESTIGQVRETLHALRNIDVSLPDLSGSRPNAHANRVDEPCDPHHRPVGPFSLAFPYTEGVYGETVATK
jgi:hypothetical protein